MRKRWWFLLAFCLLVIALGLLESQRILTGWVRGDAFYRGRPTSYWRAELNREKETFEREIHLLFQGTGSTLVFPKPFFLEHLLPKGWSPKPKSSVSLLWIGDPTAKAVLEELATDPDETIKASASWGLIIIQLNNTQ